MQEFLATLLAFPTIVFSVALVLVLLYWMVFIFGALDLDFLDSVLGLEAAEGAFDGAVESLEGVAEGALEAGAEAFEGAAEGALEAGAEAFEGAAEGAAEGATEAADADASSSGGLLAGLLTAMGVRGVPLTIVGTFIVFWAWILSYLLSRSAGRLGTGLAVSLGVALVSFSGGVFFASLTTRPMKRLFVTHQAPRRASLVGKMCTVLSGTVDDRYGRAEIDDGGAGFVAEVRAATGSLLRQGDRALVYRYEPKSGVFFIGPVDPALAASASVADES